MLLKLSVLILVSSISIITSAQTTPIEVTAGDYALESGAESLCRNFDLSENDVQGKTVTIGDQYNFEKKISTHQVESDIDEECEFREQNLRKNSDTQLILTRINEEYCKGSLRSKTVSTATFSENTITVHHQVDTAPAYTCVWKKQ